MPGQDRLLDEILGKHRLPQAVRRDKDDVLAFGQEVEGEDAFDRGPMNLFGPVPLEISHHLEAAEARVSQPALHAQSRPGVEFGLDEVLEQDDRAPALLCRAGDEIIQLVGGVEEAELPQVITQGRRDRIGGGHRRTPTDAASDRDPGPGADRVTPRAWAASVPAGAGGFPKYG